jgi:hypothetical protein
MTAPGGGFGESAHDDEANPPPAGGRAVEQPASEAPWVSPASPPAAEYPPPYPPPSYPPGYSPDYQAGYPAQYPPPIPPPPGYQPPGYGGPPYPPGPPQFGGPPAGHGPPSYPGGYYPTPDYQGGYGPSQPGTNRLAIASLISSFTGLFCVIGSIVALVLGIIALNQIKQTRQQGYGLAVAGIVIGIGTQLVVWIIAIFSIPWR